MSNLAVLVDENDEILEYRSRHKLNKGDIIRISTLWLVNDQGQILLAKRSLTKKHDPGRWGPAVAGTVEPNETYESNIIKEAAEEIGLKTIKPRLLLKELFTANDGTRRWCSFFGYKYNLPAEKFVIQKEEVDSVKWFDKEFVFKDIKNNPNNYVGSAQLWYKVLINH